RGWRRRAGLLIGADNGTYQFMPDDVALCEVYSPNSGNSFQGRQCLTKTKAIVRREIDLRHVSGDHAFGMRPDASQEHEHLLGRRVLGFFENDKGVLQRPTTYVRVRRN